MYEKFEALLKRDGVKTADVIRGTGINQTTFSHWKHGRYTPKPDKIKLIAEYFGVPMSYFYTDDAPVYEVAAGQGRINDGLPMESEKFKANCGDDHGYIKVVGESMQPALKDGDILKTVPFDGDVSPKDFCIVKVDGEALTVKHVEMTDTGVWLRALNKDVFEDKFYTTQEVMTIPIQIVGKAVSIAYREL